MSIPLWIEVCEVLKWHNQGADTCIDTLNRLWGKHTEVRGRNGAQLLAIPRLSEHMLHVDAEHWPLERLSQLTRGHERNQPKFFPPIVILRWLERDFVIDGNTRINFWLKHRNVGPHAVLTISERAK